MGRKRNGASAGSFPYLLSSGILFLGKTRGRRKPANIMRKSSIKLNIAFEYMFVCVFHVAGSNLIECGGVWFLYFVVFRGEVKSFLDAFWNSRKFVGILK